MNPLNICLNEQGARIIDFSSTSSEQDCQASNVLVEKEEFIWYSGEGLPQFLTISLEKVQARYSHISTVGFYCWHDYETNPQTIEIEVAQSPDDKLVLWAELRLELQKGHQYFNIRPLPPSYKIVKINITETFGDYETYLNQVILIAEPFSQASNSQMSASINELEPIPKDSHPWNGPFSKTQKHFKAGKGKKSPSRKIETEEVRGSSDEEYQDNTFHHRQIYSTSHDKRQRQAQQSPSYDEPEEKDDSFNNSMALLTLSKKAVEMEEDIQDVRRQLEILDIKVNCSLQNMKKHVLDNVERTIDIKLNQFKQEMRAEFRTSRDRDNLREVKSQKEKRELVTNREIQEDHHQYGLYQGKSSRAHPKSVHIQNLSHSQRQKDVPTKDNLVSGLMNQLSSKLKERLKVKRMETKEKHEEDRPRRHKAQHRY